MIIWQFLLSTLAVYRLSYLITSNERGPFDLALHLRTWVYRRWPDKDGQESWQFAGITCPLCVSFWLAFAFAAWLSYTNPVDYFVTALALAGAVTLVHKAFKK